MFAQPSSTGSGAGSDQPKFFHITPVRPVQELIAEARRAQPTPQIGDFEMPDLVELAPLDRTIKLDIRYASSHNFLSTPVYEQARAFLQRPAAEALVRANGKLHEKGFGLLIYDAYRPWYVTKVFWDATPEKDHKFVADPSKGSQHNRGCAIDLTMYNLKTGEPVAMTGLYDEMSERSYPNYTGGTEEERRNREILREAMESEGFKVYEYEWWHFDYKDWAKYPVLNVRFDDVPVASFAEWGLGTVGKVPAKPLSNPQPDYTDLAKKKCTQGTVTNYLLLDRSGAPLQVIMNKSLGDGLDESIMKTLYKWRFKPATLHGGPVPFEVTADVTMKLPNCTPRM